MSHSHVPNYGSYSGCNIFDYPSPQMSYAISMHADQQYPPSWVNPNYPIHGSVGRDQATYEWHINNYIENYASTFYWENYCSNQDRNVSYVFEPARNSFWF